MQFGSRCIAGKTNPQNLTSLKKEEHISIAGWCVAKDTSKEQPMGIHNAWPISLLEVKFKIFDIPKLMYIVIKKTQQLPSFIYDMT